MVGRGYRTALPLMAGLIGALVAVALGAAIATEGPLLPAAGLLAAAGAMFVAARPLNGLLAAVVISAVVPYWYGRSGLTVAHLASGLALVWIGTAMVLNRPRLRLNGVDYAVGAFLLAVAIDWSVRGGNLITARASADIVSPLIFYFAARLLGEESSRTVLWPLIGAVTIASFSLFYEFAHGSSAFRDPNSYYWSSRGGTAVFRPGGVFGSPPAAVTILSMVVLVAVSLAPEITGLRRVLVRTCIVVMIAAGVLTFTRAGWIGFGAGLLTYYIVLRWRGKFRLPRWLRILPVAGVAVVLALPTLSQTSWFQLGVERGGTLSVRESYWTLAAKLITDTPEHLLVGRGLNSLDAGARPQLGGLGVGLAETPDLITNGAHNQYIRTLLEQGLVGLALIFLWLGGALVVAVRRLHSVPYPQRRLLAGLAGAIVSFLVVSFADTSLNDTVSFSIISLLTGLAVTLGTTGRAGVT